MSFSVSESVDRSNRLNEILKDSKKSIFSHTSSIFMHAHKFMQSKKEPQDKVRFFNDTNFHVEEIASIFASLPRIGKFVTSEQTIDVREYSTPIPRHRHDGICSDDITHNMLDDASSVVESCVKLVQAITFPEFCEFVDDIRHYCAELRSYGVQ